MYCSYCGAKNPDENRFCGMCGELLIRAQGSEAVRRPPQRETPSPNVTVMPREPQRPVPLSEVMAEKKAAAQRRADREAERYIGEPSRTVAPPPPPPPRQDLPPAHLGGPSFLGLNDPEPAGERSPAYLLDDDDYRPRRSYGRFFMLLLILAVFAGLGYVQWRKSEGQPLSPLAGQVETGEGESAPSSESAAAAEPATPSTPADSAASTAGLETPPANPETAQGSAEAPKNETSASQSASGVDIKSDEEGARADVDDDQPQPEPKGEESATAAKPEKPTAGQREQAGDTDLTSAAGDRELELGRAYLSGRYGDHDPAEAAKWLWKAVSKGNTDASLALADLYLAGQGVEKNCDQARVLLTAAARKGNSDAASKLRTVNCE